MNYLKLINDKLGHNEGDKYLIEIANILLKYDNGYKIFRLGGDEFAIVMVDVDEIEVTDYIYRVKQACKNTNHTQYPLSIAIGYCLSKNLGDFQSMILSAESDMYCDKDEFYKDNKYNRRQRFN